MGKTKQKNKKKIIVFSAIGALVVILILVVIFGSGKEDVITVQTEKVKRMTITQVVEATGKIYPETEVKINAEVSGEIIQLPVEDGDRITKGQLLVKINPDAYVAETEQAQASLNSAKARVEQRQADLKVLERELERQKELFQKDLISESDIESMQNQYEVAKSSLAAAKFDVQNQEAFLKNRRESLRRTSIFSPIDGYVTQLISKEGERVSGSSFTQGTEIMTVSDLSLMEARVEVNENDVVLISIGDTARVEVDAYPDSIFVAVVHQIANTASTRGLGTQEEVTNFEVRLLLLTKSVQFRPGMSCTAKIETETKRDVIAVPLQSVTTREEKEKKGRRFAKDEGEDSSEDTEEQNGIDAVKKKKEDAQEVVFIVDGNLARKRIVKTGISSAEYIEIQEGLDEGAKVVKGSYRAISRELEDSTAVKIDNEGMFAKRFKKEE
ncbi:MAG: efflux transporter periplasmic adaptor subunit [Ectothiorhodospiraceae bacterium]|nr:efflux transporter periplasmic adaptor subunit [Ectothiorhodospiraceae bacterium]